MTNRQIIDGKSMLNAYIDVREKERDNINSYTYYTCAFSNFAYHGIESKAWHPVDNEHIEHQLFCP